MGPLQEIQQPDESTEDCIHPPRVLSRSLRELCPLSCQPSFDNDGHQPANVATEAEALVMREDAALTRFANSQIHQNVAETNVAINLRYVIGKRVGVASTGRTDDEGLRRLVDNAAAIASVVEELEDWGGLPEPTPIREVAGAWSDATASATPEQRAEGVRAVIAAADAAGR